MVKFYKFLLLISSIILSKKKKKVNINGNYIPKYKPKLLFQSIIFLHYLLTKTCIFFFSKEKKKWEKDGVVEGVNSCVMLTKESCSHDTIGSCFHIHTNAVLRLGQAGLHPSPLWYEHKAILGSPDKTFSKGLHVSFSFL